MAVPLLARPGVHHLVDEGDLLDGVDGVEVVFDPDAMLSEVCSDALSPVDVVVARTVLSFLQHSSLTNTSQDLPISPSDLSHTFRPISPPDEAG